ncbi:hypothetical protein BJV74DRAFT_762319 [Russula compacta]|nr:hypothetical protein BJV74DRAFT_762319 [Russula compacta]
MKFSTALTSLILILPFLTGEALGAVAVRAGGNKGGNKGGNGGKGGNQNNANNGAANDNNNNAANNTAANAAGNNNGNAQTSLTLNPAVIAKGFEQNGLNANGSEAGEVASLTSNNNFINFCLTVPNKPITNGQQIKTGSCNPAPMGIIAATTNMPSAKFTVPVNGQNFQPNTAFTISMAVNNLQTGNFVNANSNYYSAPQQVNAQGTIIGHTHFTVQAIPSFTSAAPLDPNTFAFFKGVNTAAVNGVVSAAVTAGLPAGQYRVCSINTDANHTPCLVAVAQHGSLDDCVYFSVGGNNGANAFGGAGAGNATATAGNGKGNDNGNGAAASSSAAAAASSSAAAGKGAGKQGGNNGNKDNNGGNNGDNKGQGNNKGGKGGRRSVVRQSRLGREY